MTPDHWAEPPPAILARMSNAQSGSLKLIALLAPGAGAADKARQSAVPVRRIESAEMPAPVSLTTVKLPASAKAGPEMAAIIVAAAIVNPLPMAAIYDEKLAAPRG